jgi:integrase/recombinase XerD
VPADAFLAWLAEEGRAPNTVAAYRRDLVTYSAWLERRGIALPAVTEPVVAEYVSYLNDLGRRPTSIARALSAVRSLHRYLVGEGAATADPTGDVATPRILPAPTRTLSETEVGALLDAVVGRTAVARRDRALLEVLYGAGLRISEAVGLSLADVEPDCAMLWVLDLGHHREPRQAPLGQVARKAVREWLAPPGRSAMAPVDDAVFVNARGRRLTRQGAWGIVHHYGEQAGLGDRLTPHVLRHSCAAHMLQRGADLHTVQELLGHASVTTTQQYTKLRSAYDAAHPRAADPGATVTTTR